MRLFLIVLLSFLLSESSRAQETGEDRFGSWTTYFGNHRIAEKYSIFLELQVNDYQFFQNFNQFWGFLGLNYNINENTSVQAGYAYFYTDPSFRELPNEFYLTENRIYEQLVTNGKIGSFNLNHRYRLEQRFFTDDGVTETRHRIRYRILVTRKISGPLFAQVFDEVFINFQQPTFDQNRIFVGFGYRFTNNFNVRLGYLKVHFSSTKYDRLQLFLNINTDLRKKTKDT